MPLTNNQQVQKELNFFNYILFLFIIFSVLIVLLESVESISKQYTSVFFYCEMFIGAFFSIEYFARIILTNQKKRYILSFFGIIDLIAIIPFYTFFVDWDPSSLVIIRSIRFVRIFRVLKLAKFLGEEFLLINSVKKSLPKIIIFLIFVSVILILFGSLMYLIEGSENGFTSIPKSIYWAIVTMTTVGYGDIAPQTILGQLLSSAIMLIGYGVIAVPTGIVINDMRLQIEPCHSCKFNNSIKNKYCGNCGVKLKHEN